MSAETKEAIKKTLNQSYKVVVKTVPSRPGCWDCSEISIYGADGGLERKLGGYKRNYHSYGLETWCPFSRGDKDYALYSRDYTCTRVMELPSCKDIGGEGPDDVGFCPVELHVPEIRHLVKEPDPSGKGAFVYRETKEPSNVAFVAGCIWGDDTSWKIQCFDISQVASGIIKRDERFGYIPMPKGVSLENGVSLECNKDTGAVIATLAIMQTFDLSTGECVTVDPFE